MDRTHPDIKRLLEVDPWLEPYSEGLNNRARHFEWMRDQLGGDLLGTISQGHHFFGLNRGEKDGVSGIWYREWAPEATYLALVGDFNFWDRGADPMVRDEFGTWSVFLADVDGVSRIPHAGKVKVHVGTHAGGLDRIPAYIRRVVQDPATHSYSGEFWNPPVEFEWQHQNPGPRKSLKVYEAHVGMAQEDGKVGSYLEFADVVLPRIADLGYDAVQLMAVAEHPYYGSFGYHVSSFYAPSSRFGTPEELKELVDRAHGLGLSVIMDLVHSHAVKNLNEGLNSFDGSGHQYFHAGLRGQHLAWDSLCFDYPKYEVERFLLSNVRYWLEEFHFDGYRFDGVTSMMYHDHGLGRAFSGYDDYFSGNVDLDAVVYLMLANEVAHAVRPDAITIAEDVSGMAGLARPVADGGIGFDYRLAMGVPDMWIRLLKELKDEDWSLSGIYHEMVNRRPQEKCIAYAESHDQALVGDKTIAFWLMDQQMYWNMSKFAHDPVIDRGIALHKMIRLVTFALGGEGYLNFMGNEFGHPEWVDFPRSENGYSHHYARRQWSLASMDHLRYGELLAFDKAMLRLDDAYSLLSDPLVEQLAVHEDTRQLVFRRGPLVFAFNFHATESYAGLRIPVPDQTDYQVILNSDSPAFGGKGLVEPHAKYPWQDVPMYARNQSLMIYLPARSAQVLAPIGMSDRIH